jgi:hypothetical protein
MPVRLLFFQCIEVSLPSDKTMNNSLFNPREKNITIDEDSTLDSPKRSGYKRRYVSTYNGNSKLTINLLFSIYLHYIFFFKQTSVSTLKENSKVVML